MFIHNTVYWMAPSVFPTCLKSAACSLKNAEGGSTSTCASVIRGPANPPSGPASEFPELESKYDDLRVAADYRYSAKLSWSVELRYQTFETEDWAIEGLAPDTARSLLSLGAAPYDEDVIAFAFSVRYAIGAGKE